MIINEYDTTLQKIKGFVETKCPRLSEAIENVRTFYSDRTSIKITREKSRFLLNEGVPLFSNIEIETINRCNGKCSFCPVNRYNDPREFKLMDEDVFNSILKQLYDMEYSGSLGMYSNNEPLLDKRIIDLTKRAKDMLPNCTLYIYTNGTLLTIEKFKNLIAYLDFIVIDCYNDELKLTDNIKSIYEYSIQNGLENKVLIYLRKENEILGNRAGQAKNRATLPFIMKSACLLPFEQLIVRSNGKVGFCCFDAIGEMTMGDLRYETIHDVWYSRKYMEIREIMSKDRSKIPLCKKCDSVIPQVSIR